MMGSCFGVLAALEGLRLRGVDGLALDDDDACEMRGFLMGRAGVVLGLAALVRGEGAAGSGAASLGRVLIVLPLAALLFDGVSGISSSSSSSDELSSAFAAAVRLALLLGVLGVSAAADDALDVDVDLFLGTSTSPSSSHAGGLRLRDGLL